VSITIEYALINPLIYVLFRMVTVRCPYDTKNYPLYDSISGYFRLDVSEILVETGSASGSRGALIALAWEFP